MHRIPRIIHQTWKTNQIPDAWVEWQQSWLKHHPGWEYRLWTDEDNRRFIEKHYPWFLPTYNRYPEPIMRADAVRYFLLHHYGGVYVDLDFECLRSIDVLIEGQELVLGLEPAQHLQRYRAKKSVVHHLVSNAFMASVPGHSFWPHVFEYLAHTRSCTDPVDATGPFCLTWAYDAFSRKDQIHLIPSALLFPIPADDEWEFEVRRDRDLDFAFAVHHWSRTFKRSALDPVESCDSQLLVRGRSVAHSTIRLTLSKNLMLRRNLPLVSCLMVTGRRLLHAQCAIECFQRQNYPAKELVIVDDSGSAQLAEYLEKLADARIRYVQCPPDNLTLGELRNEAIRNAQGDYVAQWDDDDLSDPQRLEYQMAAVLTFAADACCLQREMLWWPKLDRLAVSRSRIWEQSLLCRRAALTPYPPLRRGEDVPVIARLLHHHRVVLLDNPGLFVYVRHGENAVNEEDFRRHWDQAGLRFMSEKYDEALSQCAKRLPIQQYRRACGLAGEIEFPGPVGVSAPLEAEADLDVESAAEDASLPTVLILTPVKNAEPYLDRYFENLMSLRYPAEKLSLGIFESDSEDGTFARIGRELPMLEQRCRRVVLLKHDFFSADDRGPVPAGPQPQRRSILAKCRNSLLFQALRDEDWVLWIDVDVASHPADVVQRMLAQKKDIIVPHCVSDPGGRSSDLSTFRFRSIEEGDFTRVFLEDYRDRETVEVDGVGGSMLLVRGDLHRDGLVFPTFPYKGFLETEGLAAMAKDIGYSCWAMPGLEVIHPRMAGLERTDEKNI